MFTTYKALGLGKLVITVAPEYSWQECAICAFTAKGNRLSQAEFVCQRCGTTRLAVSPNAVSKNFFAEYIVDIVVPSFDAGLGWLLIHS